MATASGAAIARHSTATVAKPASRDAPESCRGRTASHPATTDAGHRNYQQPSDDQQDGERVGIDRELQEILPGAGDDPQDRDNDDDGNTDVDQQSEPPPSRRAVRRAGQQDSRRSEQQRFAQVRPRGADGRRARASTSSSGGGLTKTFKDCDAALRDFLRT